MAGASSESKLKTWANISKVVGPNLLKTTGNWCVHDHRMFVILSRSFLYINYYQVIVWFLVNIWEKHARVSFSKTYKIVRFYHTITYTNCGASGK